MASKRVSIDEYLGSRGYGGVERKQFARDDGIILKAQRVEEKAKFDKEKGTVRFVMSAEVEDRDRDIVVQAGLDTTEFMKNPVAPWAHRAGDPPVGQWSDIEKYLAGRPKRTEGTLTLTKGEPQADRLAIHFEAGSIRACSIGFMPTAIERREIPEDKKDSYFFAGFIIHEAELYECSPCSIPANPAALAKAAAAGDALSRELIEQVLDNWDLKDGLLVPRKAFEGAHREATREKTIVVIAGKRFEAGLDEKGAPTISAVEPTEAERLAETLESDTPESKGLLARLAKLLLPEPKTAADTSKAPADEISEIARKHELLEADAAFAELDTEMGQHVPA